MKYIDGAQHCIIAECNIAQWGGLMQSNIIVFLSTLTLTTMKIAKVVVFRCLQSETKISFSYFVERHIHVHLLVGAKVVIFVSLRNI